MSPGLSGLVATRTVGVEEELLLVGARQPQARPIGDDVVAVASLGPDDADFEHELKREQVEIATPPCSSLRDLAGEIRRLRAELAVAARACDAQVVVPTGSARALFTLVDTAERH